MKKFLIGVAAIAAYALPASAATVLATDGPPVTPGQFNVTYTFSPGNTGPFDPANVRSGTTSGLYAQPAGSSAPYYSVGPSTSNPVSIAYASNWGNQFYLFWGSIDTYNAIELLSGSTVLSTITGAQVASPAQGSQSDMQQNRNVTVTLSGAERSAITGLRFRSDFGQSAQNAFEFDNFSVNAAAVPEPETWVMLAVGFGLVGAGARRRRRTFAVA